MECPKCHSENEAQATECRKCGIVFAKYVQWHEMEPETAHVRERLEQMAEESRQEVAELRRELIIRVLALPVALLLARIWVALEPDLTGLLTVVVHEPGHAITAWLCGYGAIPLPAETQIFDRSIWLALPVISGVLGLGCYWFWTTRRRIVASICAAFLIIHLICIRLPEQQAQALIAFGGDAGSLVLGSFLMAMIYEPAFVENSLRWGFLGIGAATFVRTYVLWAGPEANIPFGVRGNGVLQDVSALVEKYGWTIQTMIQRYVRLGEGCLTVLAIVYVWRIHETRAEIRSHPTT